MSQDSTSMGSRSNSTKLSAIFKPTLPMRFRHSERGFTLIEVMVALAILAVVAVAASRASSAYLSSVDVLKTRTLAHFVAQNAAADLRIQQTWLTTNRIQTLNEQGRDWQVQMSVAETLSPALKQVHISVAPIIDGEARSVVTDITVLVSNPDSVKVNINSSSSASESEVLP